MWRVSEGFGHPGGGMVLGEWEHRSGGEYECDAGCVMLSAMK